MNIIWIKKNFKLNYEIQNSKSKKYKYSWLIMLYNNNKCVF